MFLATAYGAEYIERHITIDKFGDGIDDSSSSTADEFSSMSKIINNLNEIKGNKNKIINQGEKINIQNLGTSLYANKNVNKGELLSIKDFEIKAPRLGLTLPEYKKIKNKKLLNDVKKGDSISSYHFKKRTIIDPKKIHFVNCNNISIPIRFHDMEDLNQEIPVNNFE